MISIFFIGLSRALKQDTLREIFLLLIGGSYIIAQVIYSKLKLYSSHELTFTTIIHAHMEEPPLPQVVLLGGAYGIILAMLLVVRSAVYFTIRRPLQMMLENTRYEIMHLRTTIKKLEEKNVPEARIRAYKERLKSLQFRTRNLEEELNRRNTVFIYIGDVSLIVILIGFLCSILILSLLDTLFGVLATIIVAYFAFELISEERNDILFFPI